VSLNQNKAQTGCVIISPEEERFDPFISFSNELEGAV